MVFDDLVDVAGGNVEESNDGDVSVGFIDDGLNSFHVLGKASKTTPIEVLREIEFDDSIVLLGLGFGLQRKGEVMKSYLSSV